MHDQLDLAVEFLDATKTDLVDLILGLASALNILDPEIATVDEHTPALALDTRPLVVMQRGGVGLAAADDLLDPEQLLTLRRVLEARHFHRIPVGA